MSSKLVRFKIKKFSEVYFDKYLLIHACFYFRNMVLAERCVLLSAEILKSQSKYSEAAALLIRLTSEVKLSSFFHFCPLTICFLTQTLLGCLLILVLQYFLAKGRK